MIIRVLEESKHFVSAWNLLEYTKLLKTKFKDYNQIVNSNEAPSDTSVFWYNPTDNTLNRYNAESNKWENITGGSGDTNTTIDVEGASVNANYADMPPGCLYIENEDMFASIIMHVLEENDVPYDSLNYGLKYFEISQFLDNLQAAYPKQVEWARVFIKLKEYHENNKTIVYTDKYPNIRNYTAYTSSSSAPHSVVNKSTPYDLYYGGSYRSCYSYFENNGNLPLTDIKTAQLYTTDRNVLLMSSSCIEIVVKTTDTISDETLSAIFNRGGFPLTIMNCWNIAPYYLKDYNIQEVNLYNGVTLSTYNAPKVFCISGINSVNNITLGCGVSQYILTGTYSSNNRFSTAVLVSSPFCKETTDLIIYSNVHAIFRVDDTYNIETINMQGVIEGKPIIKAAAKLKKVTFNTANNTQSAIDEFEALLKKLWGEGNYTVTSGGDNKVFTKN